MFSHTENINQNNLVVSGIYPQAGNIGSSPAGIDSIITAMLIGNVHVLSVTLNLVGLQNFVSFSIILENCIIPIYKFNDKNSVSYLFNPSFSRFSGQSLVNTLHN